MRGSAGLTTAIWQVGQRNRYAPELSSMHTRTRTSAVVSSTSPQSPHVARMVGILRPFLTTRTPDVSAAHGHRA